MTSYSSGLRDYHGACSPRPACCPGICSYSMCFIVPSVRRDRLSRTHLPSGVSRCVIPGFTLLTPTLLCSMHYHHLLLTIFEALLHNDATPKDLITEAEKTTAEAHRNLQTLIHVSYLRHGYESMDLFTVVPLMLTVWECIEAINETPPGSTSVETLRSTLLLAAKGLHDQQHTHYLAKALYSVISGRLPSAEAALLQQTIGASNVEEALEEEDMKPPIRCRWPGSVVKKKQEMNSYIFSN